VQRVLRKDKGTPMLGFTEGSTLREAKQLALLRRVVPLSEAASFCAS
jgi:hypothetical protein